MYQLNLAVTKRPTSNTLLLLLLKDMAKLLDFDSLKSCSVHERHDTNKAALAHKHF